MGASSKTPATPDYTGAAQIQGQQNQQIAQQLTQANRPTQTDPYGQTTWSQTVDPSQAANKAQEQAWIDYANGQINGGFNTPYNQQLLAQHQQALANIPTTWTQNTTYTPAQQALLNQQQSLKGAQNDRIAQLLASFQTPTLAATPTLQTANQNNISNLMYQQLTQNMNKQFTQDEASQRQQLANQGFAPGSEGFNNAMNDFYTNKNQAYLNANTQANLAGYNQMNAENQQYLNDYTAQRSGNLNDYNSQMGYLAQLLGGVQGPNTSVQYPGFSPATQYSAPDLLGALSGQYQAQLNGTNAQNAASGMNMQTIGTLGTIAAMAFM